MSGANNAVDATALGIGATSVAGGGTGIGGNTINLSDTASTFLANSTQTFTFNLNTGTGNQVVTVNINPTASPSGLSGSAVISSFNTSLQAYGITASIGSSGALQFSGATAFTVSTLAAGAAVSASGTAVNSANFNVDTGAFSGAPITAGTETDVIQNAGGTYTLNLTSADNTVALALTAINQGLSGSGILAVADAAGTGVSLQSAGTFSVNQTASAGPGNGSVFTTTGSNPVTPASLNASNTGSALAALTALTAAIGSLGLVQGTVGAGENKLQYATNLAQSQITNYSAAESGLRDADIAAAAANLTKAQVLQQTSLAALSQANSAPQAVLSLLKNLS